MPSRSTDGNRKSLGFCQDQSRLVDYGTDRALESQGCHLFFGTFHSRRRDRSTLESTGTVELHG